MTAIKTYSHCLAPMIAGKAEAEAAKVAEYLQAEPAAVSGTGETDLFRYTFRRMGSFAVLRIFPHMMGHEFSGEAYAEW